MFIYRPPKVFVAYLKVLRSQLKQIPGDFFTSDLTCDNFLQEPLGALFEVCYEEQIALEAVLAVKPARWKQLEGLNSCLPCLLPQTLLGSSDISPELSTAARKLLSFVQVARILSPIEFTFDTTTHV